MDWFKILKELRAEKDRLDMAIAALESTLVDGAGERLPRRRGRKSMPPEERQVVSERMTRYWAQRRQDKNKKHD